VVLAQHAQGLADATTECPEYVTHAIVWACCPHLDDDAERMRLWAEYAAAVKQESDLLAGVIGWQDVDPELTCPDRTQAAIDMAVEMSRQALEALTGRQS